MPRKIPQSIRKKREEQLRKRAIKRGDAPAAEPKKPIKRRKADTPLVASARKLQSAFIRLPPQFLEKTREIAYNRPLTRPIPDENALYHSYDRDGDPSLDPLTCPKRPKWNFEMSKLELERNEEGNFKKWLQTTDDILDKWQNRDDTPPVTEAEIPEVPKVPEPEKVPHSPSNFERNIEVWRQLWRVTEISQIILVLLDSRCPTLHYPPSLSKYLGDRKVILVLTKVDITGPARVEAWTKYIRAQHPNVRIVQVESYTERAFEEDHQGRAKFEPSIPHHFREQLVQVIKEVHAELLEPPENIKSNPKLLRKWVCPVKKEIDWQAVMEAKGDKVGHAVGGAAAPKPADAAPESPEGSENQSRQEPSFLTIGLIGQPNVGKSSLLNALFGASKVRASKTPGKTKHFQTLFWTSDVRLVDCPGLVMPNFVPMEMQVLCGTLPISRVSAVPACIYFAANLLPLEEVYKLEHPSTKEAPPEALLEDKRTWRANHKPKESKHDRPHTWTAMDILVAYADAKGWVTAQAGRPDVHRAGNAILRALAEGRIPWGFWPPDTLTSEISGANADAKVGIYIPREGEYVDESDGESDAGAEHDGEAAGGATASDESHEDEQQDDEDEDESEEGEDSEEDDEDDEEEGKVVGPPGAGVASRFGAFLKIEEGEDDDEDET